MTKEQRKIVNDRLAEIERRNSGRLTPDDVVADAKSVDSPLHQFFEWDEKKAAHKYWIEQARQLITSVRVVIVTEQLQVSCVAYVRDPSAEPKEQGYISITKLRTDQDLAREALVNEFSRVADYLRRAREIAVALNATADVEVLLNQVVGLRHRFMDQPPAQQ